MAINGHRAAAGEEGVSKENKLLTQMNSTLEEFNGIDDKAVIQYNE
jgi:hypothetical protein